MIYGPRGEVVSGCDMAETTRELLQLSASRLILNFMDKTKFQEDLELNELRRSCGVEPEPKTIRFRRYGGKE